MKVRIGVSLGQARVADPFSAAVDPLEAAGVGSVWLPEMVDGSLADLFIGMAYGLTRTSRLKVGTTVAVLPGRHPVLVAKQLATLARPGPPPDAAGVRPETSPRRRTGGIPSAKEVGKCCLRQCEAVLNSDSQGPTADGLQTVTVQRSVVILSWPDDVAQMPRTCDHPARIPRGPEPRLLGHEPATLRRLGHLV